MLVLSKDIIARSRNQDMHNSLGNNFRVDAVIKGSVVANIQADSTFAVPRVVVGIFADILKWRYIYSS